MPKRKGKKPMNYKKGYESEDRDIQSRGDFKEKFKSANDPSWYLKDQAMASWARTISFNRPAGQSIADRYEGGASYSIPPTIAGIMTFNINPTIGIATNANDAVNTNAVKYFNEIRKRISGSRTYEAPDIMLYTIAAANLYSAYNWAARLYGLAFNFSQQNRYIGDAFLQASGVDPADFRKNLADFRLFLNAYAAKISVFAVPSTMSYFNRVNFLYSGIYADSNTAKAQIYMNVPTYFLKYDSTGSPNGGQLIAEVTPTNDGNGAVLSATVAQIETCLNNLLDAMFYDSDMYTMSGDINKAFEGNLLIANPIAEQFNVPVLYDEAVLSQFNNATLFNKQINNAQSIVTQDPNTGILLCGVTINTSLKGRDINPVLNFHKQDITIEDIFEAVPFMLSFKEKAGSGVQILDVDSMGTEYVQLAHAFYFTGTGTLANMLLNRENVIDEDTLTISAVEQMGTRIALISQFDWTPEILHATFKSTDTAPRLIKYISDGYDFDVYAVIDDEQLKRLHNIALWSMFTVNA